MGSTQHHNITKVITQPQKPAKTQTENYEHSITILNNSHHLLTTNFWPNLVYTPVQHSFRKSTSSTPPPPPPPPTHTHPTCRRDWKLQEDAKGRGWGAQRGMNLNLNFQRGGFLYEDHKKKTFLWGRYMYMYYSTVYRVQCTVYGFCLKLHVQAIIYRKENSDNFYIWSV